MKARRAAELAARNAYGRLVAYLTAQTKDVAAAEDALGDAFLSALNTWADSGVPQNPEAWLLVTARRRLIDRARRSQVQEQVLKTLTLVGPAWHLETATEALCFPDERLTLMFICAHPAIDVAIRTPLMLQTVLGLNAAQIAAAFLVAPATMGQRLVRAKSKIRDAGIAFELPEAADLPVRLAAVLDAIYAAYIHGWETIDGSDCQPPGLAAEAIWLARLCAELMPQAAEARGLLALMLYCEARRPARRSPSGAYIPLQQQDTRLWSSALIEQAEGELALAASLKQLGRFQLEAAIQSIHAQRAATQTTNWPVLAQLYQGLMQQWPTLGGWVSYAAAIAQSQGPSQSLAQLAQLPSEAVNTYQPYWALKAHLLHQLGRTTEAEAAYSRAIGLTKDPAIRAFLLHQRSLETP
jgi:predicted RNA polymerase sigma factor